MKGERAAKCKAADCFLVHIERRLGDAGLRRGARMDAGHLAPQFSIRALSHLGRQFGCCFHELGQGPQWVKGKVNNGFFHSLMTF